MHTTDTGQVLSKRERIILLGALAFATFVKAFLALKASETLDSRAFVEFLNVIRDRGGLALYEFRGTFNNPFIFPPGIIHLISAVGWISDATGLPFKFWLRLLPSLADVGSFFLIWHLLRGRKDLCRILSLLALCPTSILINGYEGNVDGFMIFWTVLAVYLLESRKSSWWAGAAFGMALNIKAVPLMFVFVLLFRSKNVKAQIQFFAATAVVILIGSMPFLVQSPGIIKNVLEYSSLYGFWGITKFVTMIAGRPAYAHWPYDPVGWQATFAGILKWLVIVVIVVVSYLMNRGAEARISLLKQFGVVISIFLLLTPGFSVQYLVWLVPFVTAAGLRATAIYYLSTTFFLLFASEVLYCRDLTCAAVMFLCWLAVGLVILEFWRSLKRKCSPVSSAS